MSTARLWTHQSYTAPTIHAATATLCIRDASTGPKVQNVWSCAQRSRMGGPSFWMSMSTRLYHRLVAGCRRE